MKFWELAYNEGWADKELLRMAVLTEENPFGEITPEQYKEITGEKF